MDATNRIFGRCGLLELLLRERKLTDDVEVLSRSVEAGVQVVESEMSAQELHLGAVREASGRGVASAASPSGVSPTGLSPG